MEIYLWGNVLSIYDKSDEIAGSCDTFFSLSKNKGLRKYKEVRLQIGLGHGVLYTPMKEWVKPVVEWAIQ